MERNVFVVNLRIFIVIRVESNKLMISMSSPNSLSRFPRVLTVLFFPDMDDGDLPLPAAPVNDCQQAAINYSTLASAVASANGPGQDPSISSTETLLRNIQGLLKVAADNARQQERQINYEKGTNSNMVYLLSLAQYYMYLAATQKC